MCLHMPFLLPWTHPLYAFAACLIGASIGSFLNVAIYRLPRGMSVNTPKRSFCPICKEPIPACRNIPLVTWLLQRGKCAECSAPIPVRYFLVELLTMLLWLGCWYVFPNPAKAVFFMLFSSVCVVICAVDIELMVIPRPLTIFGSILGFAMAGFFPEFIGEATWSAGLLKAAYGFAIGWIGLWLVVLLGKLAFGKFALKFEDETVWELKEPTTDEEQLSFVFGEEVIGWGDIFFRKSDKLYIKQLSSVVVDGVERAAESVEIQDDMVLIDGEEFPIEGLTSLSGKAKEAVVPREAMGMGDVDLLAMLGACFGPVSLILTIFAACVFSIVWALFNRMGFGKIMPFGPSIIAGAVFWVFWGEGLWNGIRSC